MKSMSRVHSRTVAIFIGSLLNALSNQAFAQGTWETKAPMPTARYGQAAGVIGGKFYVASGCCESFSSPFSRFTALEVYDPANDTWATGAPIPLAIYAAAAGVIGGKLYVAGGAASPTEGNTVATLQVYDATNDTWTTKASMPTAIHGAASGVINGKLYAAGGHNGTFTNALHVYDAAGNSWTTKTPMPTTRHFPGGGVINGILYVVGGHDDNGFFATLEVYDPATDNWTTKAPMPTARTGSAVEVINGILYVVGGYDGSFWLDTVEAYDPATDTWTAKAAMPTARLLPAVGVVTGILYAAGGLVNGIIPLNVLEAFTPEVIEITVAIDIKPGSFPNSINLKSKGVVPVAILGSASFNVDDVAVNTVTFAGASPVRFSFADVNLDGHVDLVFHFRTQDLQLTTSSTQATLTGETTGGVPITGTDSVRIVK